MRWHIAYESKKGRTDRFIVDGRMRVVSINRLENWSEVVLHEGFSVLYNILIMLEESHLRHSLQIVWCGYYRSIQIDCVISPMPRRPWWAVVRAACSQWCELRLSKIVIEYIGNCSHHWRISLTFRHLGWNNEFIPMRRMMSIHWCYISRRHLAELQLVFDDRR